MKIVSIGDIHGRNTWKQIVDKNQDADLFIFIGDFVDSFHISGIEQLHNLKEIVKFKQDNPTKVILLCGNHDYHYLTGIESYTKYSGFQLGMKWDFATILDSLVRSGEMVIAYEHNNYLFSHAGLSETWCTNKNLDKNNIVDEVNMLFQYRVKEFGKCTTEESGNDIHEGPLWIRPQSLKKDYLKKYHHIVGHTATNEIMFYENVTTIDSLYYGEYLIIVDDIVSIGKI